MDEGWGHLLVFVEALRAAGNVPLTDGFTPTQGAWQCLMAEPLDEDLLRPLLAGDEHDLALGDDRLFCPHCWSQIMGATAQAEALAAWEATTGRRD